MADFETRHPTEMVQLQVDEKNLKYLDFVQVAAIYLLACISSIYEYAKENSGPLKSGVQTVEGTVKNVIGPVVEKFHGVPFELLWFIDRKVDESLNDLEHHVPSLVKQLTSHSYTVARAVASEVQNSGVVDATRNITKTIYIKYEPTAKEIYTKYEPVAEQYVVSVWRSLNRLPLFRPVADIVIPTATYWSERYNQTVHYTAEQGYPVASSLPFIPIEKIAKVFEEAESGPDTNGECIAVAQ